ALFGVDVGMVDAPDSGTHGRGVEVEDQTCRQISELQVSDDLRLMHGMDPIDRFHLNDQPAIDEDVDSQAFANDAIAINDVHPLFQFDREPTVSQLGNQAVAVQRIEKAAAARLK